MHVRIIIILRVLVSYIHCSMLILAVILACVFCVLTIKGSIISACTQTHYIFTINCVSIL